MSTIAELLISDIAPDPDQPRKDFDAEALHELAQSIVSYGLLEPIIVRRDGDAYRIIAGERRWRAAQIAGLTSIPAIIREIGLVGAFELSMVENLVRRDMNPIEEADGYQRLLDLGMDLDQIAARLGKRKGAIEHRLRLNRLAPAIRDLVRTGQISPYTGSQLASLSHEGQFRFIRAMTNGDLPDKDHGDMARLISAIRADEEQMGAFPETSDEQAETTRTARAIDALQHLTNAAAALERANDRISGANDLERLAAVADSIKVQAARVASAVHAQRARQIAQAHR